MPWNPLRQLQNPNTGSQVELFWHGHLFEQLNPYVPAEQAVKNRSRMKIE